MEKIQWFFELAKTTALKSKDRSTKVGCVIVGPDAEPRSLGYNGFVRGANDNILEWHERPLKYDMTAHAEENAICNAARYGAPLKGCVVYVTLPPCSHCSLLLAQAGIAEINFLVPLNSEEWKDRWSKNFKTALTILRSGKVRFRGWSGEWSDDGDLRSTEVECWLKSIDDSKFSNCLESVHGDDYERQAIILKIL